MLIDEHFSCECKGIIKGTYRENCIFPFHAFLVCKIKVPRESFFHMLSLLPSLPFLRHPRRSQRGIINDCPNYFSGIDEVRTRKRDDFGEQFNSLCLRKRKRRRKSNTHTSGTTTAFHAALEELEARKSHLSCNKKCADQGSSACAVNNIERVLQAEI